VTNVAKHTFARGEITPLLYARTDQAAYQAGLRTCRNWIVRKQGGLDNRPGTEFVGLAPTGTTVRLLPFVFNATQTYALEFSDRLIRFVRQGGYVASGGVPVTVVTPYLQADLPGLQIAQSADVVTIVHPNYPPMELKRFSDTSWTLTVIVFGPKTATPTGVVIYPGGASTGTQETYSYQVTAIDPVTAVESLPTPLASIVGYPPTAAAPNLIVWAGQAGVKAFNVYLVITPAPARTAAPWDAVTAYTVGQFVYVPIGGGPSVITYRCIQANTNVTPPNAAYWIVWPGLVQSSGAGAAGFIGTAQSDGVTSTVAFADPGLSPDMTSTAPIPHVVFSGAGNYPAAVGYYQQRRLFAGTTNAPETVLTSKSADYSNFSTSSPSEDDDALTFTLAGRVVNQVRHIIDGSALVIFCSGGEWVVGGDASGVLRPADINALNFSEHGAGPLRPIKIDRRIIYVQARAAIVRDIAKDFYYGYQGTDLTTLSSHLFEQHTLLDWAYQETPHSLIWCVRDDGTLLCLTDVKEQEVLAWTRHDTLGTVENVCVVPEGDEDRLYVVVVRNGVRMIERLASRAFATVEDAIFTDATLSYDGRNTSATTMALSGGTTWASDELLTATASAPTFGSWLVGDQVVVTDPTGIVVRLTVQTIVSPTVVTGFPSLPVPQSLRGMATVAWSRAVPRVGGLSHLEGRQVSIVADGHLVANPNNPQIPFVCTVAGGVAAFDAPYSYVHVGLPYVSDFETLDIDTPEGASLKEKKLLINRIGIEVANTRGLFTGSLVPASDADQSGLYEAKSRYAEAWNAPVNLLTDTFSVNITATWSNRGRFFVRQVDPLPASVLAVIATGYIPQASA
jgi:hypothetical protein